MQHGTGGKGEKLKGWYMKEGKRWRQRDRKRERKGWGDEIGRLRGGKEGSAKEGEWSGELRGGRERGERGEKIGLQK